MKIKTKKKIPLKSMKNKNRYGGGKVSDLRRVSLTVSPISVWQLRCVLTSTVLTLGSVVWYKPPPGRQSAGRFRWLKSKRTVGWLSW